MSAQVRESAVKPRFLCCTNPECPCENPQTVSNFAKRSEGRKGCRSRCKTCENARVRKPHSYPEYGKQWRRSNAQKSHTYGGVKRCATCEAQKPATPEFFRRKSAAKDGLDFQCKVCANKNSQKAHVPIGHQLCPGCKAVFPLSLEHFNRRTISSTGFAYRCRTCARDVTRKSYLAHREKRIEEARDASLMRSSLKRGARTAGEVVTRAAIEKKIAQQKGKCFYCGCKLERYHLDHFIPIASGGLHTLGNIVIACPTCNLRKNKRDPFEFMAVLESERIAQRLETPKAA